MNSVEMLIPYNLWKSSFQWNLDYYLGVDELDEFTLRKWEMRLFHWISNNVQTVVAQLKKCAINGITRSLLFVLFIHKVDYSNSKKSYNNAQPTKAMRCFLKYLQQSQLASHEVWSSLTLLRMGLPSISWISFISSIWNKNKDNCNQKSNSCTVFENNSKKSHFANLAF